MRIGATSETARESIGLIAGEQMKELESLAGEKPVIPLNHEHELHVFFLEHGTVHRTNDDVVRDIRRRIIRGHEADEIRKFRIFEAGAWRNEQRRTSEHGYVHLSLT